MKKIGKIIFITLIPIVLIILSILIYNDYRIKHAKIEVETIESIEVFSETTLKDLIKSINGKLIENKKINTTKIGKKQINFKYINDDNIKVSYSFTINIIDNTPPIVYELNSITINKGTDNIKSRIFYADYYDNNPKAEIIGDYNVDEVGTYQITFKVSDSSGNITERDIIINVIEPVQTKIDQTTTNYNDIYSKFKNENTKIGIDVSYHQGDIDFSTLKEANVEFAFIRVGYGEDKDNNYVLDDKFIQNIKGFNEANIPVGIYFYSYGQNSTQAKKEAKWVLKQIKNYQVDLPIVFDWENWNHYQDYHLNLYNLNIMASSFIKEVQSKNYQGMLYSSKNYLKYAWNENDYQIWIAHYNENENYENKYQIWQICNDGKIDGINSPVDIDIMYS